MGRRVGRDRIGEHRVERERERAGMDRVRPV
ncbi:hypothetical protein FAIPA1_360007 [Frankia sp. AiPs1]